MVCNAIISQVTETNLIIQNPYFKGLVYTHSNPNMKKGKKGDIIPISILNAGYFINSENITVLCSLLNFPICGFFKLSGDPKSVDISSFKNFELSANEIKKLSKYDDVLVKYNKTKTFKGISKFLSQFTSLKEGDIISKPPHLSRFQGFMVMDKSEIKNIEVIEQNASVVFMTLLEDYVKFTNLYKSMIDNYSTEDFNTYKRYYN